MAYLANRVALLILTLFLVSIIAFSITNLLPGNVAKMMLGLKGTPEMLANLENALGLNDPLPQQYWRWFSGMLQGDMGNSIRFKEPIAKLLGQKLAVSSILMVMSLFIAFVLAIPLGIISAVKRIVTFSLSPGAGRDNVKMVPHQLDLKVRNRRFCSR